MKFNDAKILFISLIPHLRSEKGHYYAYHRSLEKATELLGIPFRSYVSKKCEIDLPNNWIRFFPSKNLPIKKVWNALFRSYQYFRLFSKSRKKERRIFFLECFREPELFLVAVAFAIAGRRRDSLWLLYRYDLKSFRYRGKILLMLTRLLKRVGGSRLQLFTDSELIFQQLQPRLGKSIHLAPIPHTDLLPLTKKNKQSICLWWPGDPRKSKGLLEVQEILNFKNQTKNRFSFIASKEAQLFSEISTIEIVQAKEMLTRQEYLETMQKSDVILLPYSPEFYAVSTSGIFVEAVVSGKVPLVKKGTWLTHELKKYGLNELIIDWSNPSFFTRVSEICEDPSILGKLKQMKEDYMKFHSIEGYAQTVYKVIQESFS